MEIIIKDSHGNECNIGDIILLHFINENYFYLGVLEFDKDDFRFIITDMCGEYKAVKPPFSTKKERFFNIKEKPSLKKELGIIELRDGQSVETIYELLNK